MALRYFFVFVNFIISGTLLFFILFFRAFEDGLGYVALLSICNIGTIVGLDYAIARNLTKKKENSETNTNDFQISASLADNWFSIISIVLGSGVMIYHKFYGVLAYIIIHSIVKFISERIILTNNRLYFMRVAEDKVIIHMKDISEIYFEETLTIKVQGKKVGFSREITFAKYALDESNERIEELKDHFAMYAKGIFARYSSE